MSDNTPMPSSMAPAKAASMLTQRYAALRDLDAPRVSMKLPIHRSLADAPDWSNQWQTNQKRVARTMHEQQSGFVAQTSSIAMTFRKLTLDIDRKSPSL